MPSTEPRIRDWPVGERPPDKLANINSRYLSDADLLAMLIGPGNARCNRLELARKVLAAVKGRISELCKKSVLELMQIPGIGRAKASAIYAFAELSRRRELEKCLEKFQVKDTLAAVAFFRTLLRDLDHEEFGVLFLNQGNYVINFEIVSMGGITATYVDPRLIFKKALLYNAVSIIVAHNHPSGQVIPSQQDELLTCQLVDGAEYLEIKLLDHLIVTEYGFYSFAAKGKLQ